MTNYTRKFQSKRCAKLILTATAALTTTLAATILLSSMIQQVNAASARNTHQVLSPHTNQFFLNEFCDLKSKTIRNAKNFKQTSDTHQLYLTSKNTQSSVRVLPQQKAPSTISFGFGSSQSLSPNEQQQQFKQLNCSIIVVGPKSHGLLVTVNSIGLPKNLTKLGITLNHDSIHAQHISLEGETKTAHYLLTEQNTSSIAINLQTFQPIDWSHVSFDILFTVYKKANGTTGCPNKNWFDCGDNICVPSSSICDGNRNCPNGSDEMTFYRCYSQLFWSIAASTSLALILIIVIVLVLLIVRRRRINGLGGKQSLSLSDNANLASENDLMANDNNSSKLDLTQHSIGVGNATIIGNAGNNNNRNHGHYNNYLASNLYLGGFENPVWQNGTLTKSSTTSKKLSISSNQ